MGERARLSNCRWARGHASLTVDGREGSREAARLFVTDRRWRVKGSRADCGQPFVSGPNPNPSPARPNQSSLSLQPAVDLSIRSELFFPSSEDLAYSADRCSLLPHPVVVVVFLRRRDSGSGSASCGESALTDSVPLLFSILMQPISSVRFLGASSSLFLD